MTSHKVYRVQDKEGRGPWKPGFSMKWVENRDDLDNLHPWFREFGDVRRLIPNGMIMGSACLSIEQLRRWFTPGEYQTLLGFGYQAVAIEASVAVGSDIQCVIYRAKAFEEDAEPIELYPGEQFEKRI